MAQKTKSTPITLCTENKLFTVLECDSSKVFLCHCQCPPKRWSPVVFPKRPTLSGRMHSVLPVSPAPTGSSATSFTKTPLPSDYPACCFPSTWKRNQYAQCQCSTKNLFVVHTQTQACAHAGLHEDPTAALTSTPQPAAEAERTV